MLRERFDDGKRELVLVLDTLRRQFTELKDSLCFCLSPMAKNLNWVAQLCQSREAKMWHVENMAACYGARVK